MANTRDHRSHHSTHTSSPQPYLNIIQHNCNHSYTATDHLRINIQSKGIQISILQEPYYLNDKIIGFSLTDIAIHHHSKPRAAIIMHTKTRYISYTYNKRYCCGTYNNTNNKLLYYISVRPTTWRHRHNNRRYPSTHFTLLPYTRNNRRRFQC